MRHEDVPHRSVRRAKILINSIECHRHLIRMGTHSGFNVAIAVIGPRNA